MDRRHFLPLALCAAAFCGALLASRPSAPAAAGAAAAGLSEVTYKMANWSDCASFDDDTTYTAVSCAAFDVAACNHHCTSGWCLDLCGSSCASGAGAICAAEYLNDIETTCAHIETTMLSAAAVEGSAELSYGQGAAFGDALSNGCDHHLYCGFCDSGCKQAVQAFPDGAYESGRLNVGPHLMRIMNNLTDICASRRSGGAARAAAQRLVDAPPASVSGGSAPGGLKAGGDQGHGMGEGADGGAGGGGSGGAGLVDDDDDFVSPPLTTSSGTNKTAAEIAGDDFTAPARRAARGLRARS